MWLEQEEAVQEVDRQVMGVVGGDQEQAHGDHQVVFVAWAQKLGREAHQVVFVAWVRKPGREAHQVMLVA